MILVLKPLRCDSEISPMMLVNKPWVWRREPLDLRLRNRYIDAGQLEFSRQTTQLVR